MKEDNKLLIICGPTATGKTSLALSLAEKFDGELVSADSRQVYKHMDVITGKDVPANARYETSAISIPGFNIGYYKTDNTRMWGYDLVSPDEEFSVYHYSLFARLVIQDILKRGKLPIVVGGTGLYINSIINDFSEINIPPNLELRVTLKNKSSEELFEMLMDTDPIAAELLNESDSKNPVRLIRRIEIAKSTRHSKTNNTSGLYYVLKICLNIPDKEVLDKQIDKRVDARVGKKLDKEIDYLIQHGFQNTVPQKTIGYKEWFDFVNDDCTKDEAIKKWKQSEHKYAKRQLTWFRKQKEMEWFDVTDTSYKKNIENLVKTWYKND